MSIVYLWAYVDYRFPFEVHTNVCTYQFGTVLCHSS